MDQDEAGRIRALHDLELLDTGSEDRFDRLARLAAKAFETPVAALTLVDRDRQWFKAITGLDVSQTEREVSFCDHVVAARALMVVPDAKDDPRFQTNHLVTAAPGIRFYAGAPVFDPTGQHVLGALCVIDTKPRTPTVAQLDMLTELAEMATQEIADRASRKGVAAQVDEMSIERTLYKLTMSNVPALIAVVGRDRRYRMVNPAFRQLYGDIPKAGMAVWEVLGEDRYAVVKPYLDRAFGGEEVHFEAQGTDANGAPIVYEVRYTPNVAPNGRVDSVTSLGIDITRRRRLLNTMRALAELSIYSDDEAGARQRLALARIRDLMGMTFAGIGRRDEDGQVQIELVYKDGTVIKGDMPLARRMVSRVLETGEELTVRDTCAEGWMDELTDDVQRIRAFIGEPIRIGTEIWGCLGLADFEPRPQPYEALNLEAVRLAATILAGEIARQRAEAAVKAREAHLHELAITDPLTGLFNRGECVRLGRQEIERARRYNRPFSLAILDLDHFKRINDTRGHAAGDDVLREAAQRMLACMREADHLCRIGSEEFAILMPETDLAGARLALQKVAEAIAQAPFALESSELRVTASAGVAQWGPGETLDMLMHRADQALYEAKAKGRNRVEAAAAPPSPQAVAG